MQRIRFLRETTFPAGTHCGGWNAVLTACRGLHDDAAEIIFDDFVEASFVWGNVSVPAGESPWCGVIHQTNSVHTLPNNEEFLRRLAECRMLLTLSSDLRARFIANFEGPGITMPPIILLVNPTHLA